MFSSALAFESGRTWARSSLGGLVVLCIALLSAPALGQPSEQMPRGAAASSAVARAKPRSSRVAREVAPPEARVHTYSIVARDPKTGELGVAVHSHWFQVGAMVPWARSGAGAIATQALTNVEFGPQGLKLLEQGKSAEQVLKQLIAADDKRDQRQLAIVDRQGRVAAWTGKRCLQAAGHMKGPSFSVQANLMENRRVWPAMAQAFRRTKGPLAERMLAAMHAAEAAGGDLRGRQSAAILVVGGTPTGKPWQDRLVDFRVADHPRPIAELERLLKLRRGYDAASEAGALLEQGKLSDSAQRFAEAQAQLSPTHEIAFWHGIALYEAKHVDEAVQLLRPMLKEARWRSLLGRLPAAQLLPRASVQDLLRRAGPVRPTPARVMGSARP